MQLIVIVIRDMQIKATLRYYLTPVTKAIINKYDSKLTNVEEVYRERNSYSLLVEL